MNRDFPFLPLEDQRALAMDAWVSVRKDTLYADPVKLARSLNDFSVRGAEGPLADLLAALMNTEEGVTASDKMILRYNAAMEVLESLVKEAIDSEAKAGEPERFIDDTVEHHG